jgi:hypothetical protein
MDLVGAAVGGAVRVSCRTDPVDRSNVGLRVGMAGIGGNDIRIE